MIAYNVACGQWATPERIAQELKVLKPDIVLLSEVPKVNRGKKVKDWSQRLADALRDLDHVHVGTVSSAGHKSPKWGDPTGNYGGKFKSILSRTPLSGGKDISVEGSGWKRASAVRAETEIGEESSLCIPSTFLDLHTMKQSTEPHPLPGKDPNIKARRSYKYRKGIL